MAPRAIVVDWGTTSFRAWLVETGGNAVIDEIKSGKGLRDLERAEFPGYCRETLAAWRGASRGNGPTPVYMAGMVGSAQGWLTAPQPLLPIDLAGIAAGTVPAKGLENAWILPGCRRVDAEAVPDVMRGEEVQIMGALRIAARDDAVLCLPGTHSKWAWARGGSLTDFTTSMTGEIYGALLQHTLIARTAEANAPWSEDAFEQGLAQSRRQGGLLHHVFTTRSRHLAGELDSAQTPSYLSGLLIGHELGAMTSRLEGKHEKLLVVGADALRRPYETALARAGHQAQWIDASSATLAGVLAVAPLLSL